MQSDKNTAKLLFNQKYGARVPGRATRYDFLFFFFQSPESGSVYWSWVVGRGSQVVGRGSWVPSRGSWVPSRGSWICIGVKTVFWDPFDFKTVF